ncbi:hypothetical protein NQ315_004229 [Exocentrus adspersus]|uniref:Large ribosomal subunit protein mL38 n=1 Tax=Exocentrus adspersus TaxID=1586481 RepID=A0AAV8W7G1_9CUCU|nr:hypothetical protein NQ315_004229 [Exocentrus adspersus]
MASSLWKLCNFTLNTQVSSPLCGAVRNGHHIRGVPPGIAKSLKQKQEEWNYKDPSIHFRVDISLPPSRLSRTEQLEERLKFIKAQKKNPEVEKLAREKKLLIDLDEVKKEWEKTSGPYHIKQIADHYGIFEHLYGDAYFYPRVPLDITYDVEEGKLPVYFGNTVKPLEAKSKPEVAFESDGDSLWTLVLTNPDGHFTEPNSEYVHWFIGNIPGNKVGEGETIVEYLQPFPPKGTGYQRLVFVLYKQEKPLDFSNFKRDGPCLTLSERTFSTYNFYKHLQDHLTPAGLAFFNSIWDSSLKEFYHKVLNMKEPIFEYDFPPPFIRKQEWFPLRKPFNLYMDKYRDPKQINKEFLMRKLKNVHPFQPTPPPLPYPMAQYWDGYVPMWLKTEITKSRLNMKTFQTTPFRIRFRIPSTREQKPTNNSKWPCCKVDKPEVEFITALVFLLPTMILFHPILSIVTCVLEIILHSWVHKKNKTLRDGTFYYKSPLHGIVKEFCGRCKDQQTKDKITKIQDMRNNKMQRYELEYIKSMVT